MHHRISRHLRHQRRCGCRQYM